MHSEQAKFSVAPRDGRSNKRSRQVLPVRLVFWLLWKVRRSQRAVAGGTQAARPGTNGEAVYNKKRLLSTLLPSPYLVQSRLQGLGSVLT